MLAWLLLPKYPTQKPTGTLEWDYSQTVSRINLLEKYINAKLSYINFDKERAKALEIVTSEKLKTPNDVLLFIKRLKYISDPFGGLFDKQYTIEEILNRGGGDCDDFAHLSCQLLSVIGYKAYYVTMCDVLVRYSHTVCLFIDGTKVYVIDQVFIRQIKSERELLNFYSSLYEGAVYYAIDVRNSRGKICKVGD